MANPTAHHIEQVSYAMGDTSLVTRSQNQHPSISYIIVRLRFKSCRNSVVEARPYKSKELMLSTATVCFRFDLSSCRS